MKLSKEQAKIVKENDPKHLSFSKIYKLVFGGDVFDDCTCGGMQGRRVGGCSCIICERYWAIALLE